MKYKKEDVVYIAQLIPGRTLSRLNTKILPKKVVVQEPYDTDYYMTLSYIPEGEKHTFCAYNYQGSLIVSSSIEECIEKFNDQVDKIIKEKEEALEKWKEKMKKLKILL